MDLAQYLARIDYSSPLTPTLETLSALQLAHMRAVPFENLDIVPLHRPIRLDEQSLWDKIVVRRRGGFCYELNGLFAWLLRQAGFEVTYLNARVFGKDGRMGMDFDHLTLLVGAPGQQAGWLADVGFGDSFEHALELHEGEEPDGLRAYRLRWTGNGYILWQRDYDGNWQRQYFFDLVPRQFPAEYEAGCTYHQRSPASSFTQRSVISRALPDGRVTLEPTKLIITRKGQRHETETSEGDWPALLKEHFGVVL